MQSMLQQVDDTTFPRQSSTDALSEERAPLQLEALGMMTAGIAHDLGNIIQVLSGTIELLDQHPSIKATTTLQPPMRRAVNSVGRASALIAQVLRFARGGSAENESVDLKQCLDDLKPLLRWISRNRMRLDVQVDADTPPLVCNRADLENAILNLAVNARDAMSRRGALSITAVPRRKDRRVDAVEICISDTGIGMSPQIMARALEPFFSTKAVGAGSGLGLPMVHRFALAAGGNVVLKSKPGVGTTVTLLLPVRPRRAKR